MKVNGEQSKLDMLGLADEILGYNNRKKRQSDPIVHGASCERKEQHTCWWCSSMAMFICGKVVGWQRVKKVTTQVSRNIVGMKKGYSTIIIMVAY